MLRLIDMKDIEYTDQNDKGWTIDYELDLVMNVKLKAFTRTEYDDVEGLASNELIHLKILTTGEIGEGNIFIELTSEEDLFFHYKCE